MGRRILYKIEDAPDNTITPNEWVEVGRMQLWYNLEFSWTAGKLAFKRYVIFPNTEEFQDMNVSIWDLIAERQSFLAERGLSELEQIRQLEKDRLVIVKWGGYFDNCLASGFTRVADNEWNAFLVCDFLLKASTLCPAATIVVKDEGYFVKPGTISFRNGVAFVPKPFLPEGMEACDLMLERCLFSSVDASKYDEHPTFRNLIHGFNQMKADERIDVVRNWNWLGYENSSGEDVRSASGFDLHAKLRKVEIMDDLARFDHA